MTTVTAQPEEKEQLLMPETDKKLLKELYLKRSYSGNEEAVRSVITKFLDNLKIPYVNFNGNILGFNYPGAPLFSAHMDMVNTERYKLLPGTDSVGNDYVFTLDNKTNIRLYRDKEKKHQTSLGADDKNGIWVILTLLRKGREINFAFCHSEEIGGAGSTQIVQDEELAQFIEGCQYGIIIDRRNSGDIIGYGNKYCMGLDDRLEAFSKERGFKYTTAHGSISDADRFSQLIECVNISCAYYEPHTSNEYTNLNELWNTLLFCEMILDRFNYVSVSPKRMQDFKNCKSPYAKTVTTYSYYSKKDDEDKEDEKKSTIYQPYKSYYTNKTDEKKTSEKKTQKKMIIHTTGGKDTDIDESKLSQYFYDALDKGSAYSPELNVFLVPLYRSDEVPPGAEAEALAWFDCAECGQSIALMQGSIDSLYIDYYNRYKDKVFGFCSYCFTIIDVTADVKYLL